MKKPHLQIPQYPIRSQPDYGESGINNRLEKMRDKKLAYKLLKIAKMLVKS